MNKTYLNKNINNHLKCLNVLKKQENQKKFNLISDCSIPIDKSVYYKLNTDMN